MKIRPKVTQLPEGKGGSKYAELIEQIKGLGQGEWIPVEFDTQEESEKFRNAVHWIQRKLGFKVSLRTDGLMLYIGKRPQRAEQTGEGNGGTTRSEGEKAK